MTSHAHLPYKSTAAALLFCVILGPVGLLYASIWGGLLFIILGVIALSNSYYFIALLIWLAGCVWGVSAVESYNKKLKRVTNDS